VRIVISRPESVYPTSTVIYDEKYPIPKKNYGGDRLALQHHIFKYIWQSNFSAPVNDKLETVILDLTPPTPQNVSIQYCDTLSRLPFEDETFDFIYVRFMACEIPENKFEEIINELERVLKTGGYLEIMDIDAQGGNEGMLTQEFMSSGNFNTNLYNLGLNISI
ncbi:10476_t:CDS:2, partial [Racocetra fulgida]